MSKIAFDNDSVLVDDSAIIKKCLKKDFDFDFKVKEHKNFRLDIDAPIEMIIKSINDAYADEDNMDLFEVTSPHNYDFLNYICYLQEKIHVVTARLEYIIKATEATLERLYGDIPFDINIAGNNPKIDVIKSLGCDIFVDDRFKTCVDLAPHLKRVYMVNRPWNDRPTKLPSNVIRINEIYEIDIVDLI